MFLLSKVFSLLDNCIFQLSFVLDLCKLFCNLGFTSQCLDCSWRNTNQEFDFKNLGGLLCYLLAQQSISMRSRHPAEFPFPPLFWRRDCHVNYKVLVGDLRANKNAILWEISVTSAAGSVFFQWSVEVSMRFRDEPKNLGETCEITSQQGKSSFVIVQHLFTFTAKEWIFLALSGSPDIALSMALWTSLCLGKSKDEFWI